jgi:hypothetical protein
MLGGTRKPRSTAAAAVPAPRYLSPRQPVSNARKKKPVTRPATPKPRPRTKSPARRTYTSPVIRRTRSSVVIYAAIIQLLPSASSPSVGKGSHSGLKSVRVLEKSHTRKSTLEKKVTSIILDSAVSGNGPCRRLIGLEYLKGSLGAFGTLNEAYAQNDIRVCAIDENKNLVGFLIGRSEANYLYLEIVCAKQGYGATLLDFFEKLAIGYKLEGGVKLSALPNVLGFYYGKGYEFKSKCSSTEALHPPKPFREMPCVTYKSGDYNCYIQNKETDGKVKVSETKTLNRPYMDFMLELYDKGLVTPVDFNPQCSPKVMNQKRTDLQKMRHFRDEACAINGIIMRKCTL